VIVVEAFMIRFRAYLHKLLNDIQSDLTEFRQAFKNDWSKIPNLFTEFRLICSPIPSVLLLADFSGVWWSWVIAIIFGFVAVTDKIDGFLARRLNQVTRLGEALDPVVDKALIAQTLIAMIIVNPVEWIKISMYVIVICEIIVVWLSFRAKHQETAVAVTYFGKFKMFVQCAVIFILFMPIEFATIFYQIIVYSTTTITLISLIIYLFRFYLRRKKVR
jgi:CDP-diacylglycerol--glycerol-3-phosphate 3-phosphatidyltransferase